MRAAVIPSDVVLLFSEIFLVANSDDKVVAVLGHEIAHAPARHGAAGTSATVSGTLITMPILPFILGGMILPPLTLIPAATWFGS